MINPNQSNLENYNAFGFVFQDRFFVARECGFTTVSLNEIKVIKLVNNRDLKINFLVFIISIVAIYFFFLDFNHSLSVKILSVVLLQPFLIFSIFYKKFNHKLIVITKNYQLILTNVNSNSKKQAKETVLKVRNMLVDNYIPLEAY